MSTTSERPSVRRLVESALDEINPERNPRKYDRGDAARAQMDAALVLALDELRSALREMTEIVARPVLLDRGYTQMEDGIGRCPVYAMRTRPGTDEVEFLGPGGGWARVGRNQQVNLRPDDDTG